MILSEGNLNINSSPEKNIGNIPPNPFSATTVVPLEKGVFADHAVLLRRSFLYRVIRLEQPFDWTLTYSGWWFRQTVEINGVPCWFEISWLTIRPRLEFQLPAELTIDPGWGDPTNRKMSLEIQFSRGLLIRRFRIWLGGRILYDEIN